jgi:hypothetical protein
MGIQQIRDYYRIPATRGCTVRVRINDKPGTITSAYGFRLRVNVDGRVGIYHPYDLDYLVDDEWLDSKPVRDTHEALWGEFNKRAASSSRGCHYDIAR